MNPACQAIIAIVVLISAASLAQATIEDCMHTTGQASVTPMSWDNNCLLAVETAPASSADTLPALLVRDEGPYAVGDTIWAEFTRLYYEGVDPEMGPYVMQLRAGYQSLGHVVVDAVDASGNLTSGEAHFDVFMHMAVPDQNMSGHTGTVPVPLEGHITQLPAVGAVLEMPSGTASIALINDSTGAIEGRLCSISATVDSTCSVEEPGCCTAPSVGNVDASPDGLVTMSDLTILIDHLFISLQPLACPEEGNVDMSSDELVTMGDLTVLIDHLFISLNPLPPCP